MKPVTKNAVFKQKLLAVYEQSSGQRLDRLMEEFFSCAMKLTEDVVQYVARLQKLFSELNYELGKLTNVGLPDLLLELEFLEFVVRIEEHTFQEPCEIGRRAQSQCAV
uniref:Uncharacterized protein n=1 Tax=Trichuris muris TaxID=70415 RepID=A0A5S6Q5J4_TRIMR